MVGAVGVGIDADGEAICEAGRQEDVVDPAVLERALAGFV